MEQCTFACHVAAWTCQLAPHTQQDVQISFLDRVVNINPMLEAELESALNNKDPNFHVRDLATISHILNTTMVSSGGGTVAAALERELNQAKLSADQHTRELFVKELDYDKKCIRVHIVNVLSADRSQQQERNMWKAKVRADVKGNINKFVANVSACVKAAAVPEKQRRNHMVAQLQAMITDVAKRFAVDASQIITIPILNYSAPSTVKKRCKDSPCKCAADCSGPQSRECRPALDTCTWV